MSPEILRQKAEEAVKALVSLYGDKIARGLSRDDLFLRLEMEIEEARSRFLNEEVPAGRPEALRHFDAALNDALLGDQGHFPCPIW